MKINRRTPAAKNQDVAGGCAQKARAESSPNAAVRTAIKK